MNELARSLTKLICVIAVKTGDDGKMFGAVTAGMIADELKHQFDVTLDKRKIKLNESLRSLGEHEVELHLHADVNGTLKVRIDSSTPLPAPVVEEKEEAKGDDARGDKRKRPVRKAAKTE
jgi:large subunit ribosomal protein L9